MSVYKGAGNGAPDEYFLAKNTFQVFYHVLVAINQSVYLENYQIFTLPRDLKKSGAL